MSFVVRPVAPEEVPVVGAITVAAYRDDGYVDAADDYVHELADAASRAREAEVWVAVEDDEVLGSVTFCVPGSPFAELAGAAEGEFRMLGVAASARRRGIAEALVRRCIERSRELGHEALVMSSMAEMTTAHRLYARLGFVRAPERDWSPVAGVNLLAFRLPLG
jgi:ribosomal protein S18 acetylase RimI-like enzyme